MTTALARGALNPSVHATASASALPANSTGMIRCGVRRAIDLDTQTTDSNDNTAPAAITDGRDDE